MDQTAISKLLKTIGIAGWVVTALSIGALALFAYRTYRETKLINLQIKELEKKGL